MNFTVSHCPDGRVRVYDDEGQYVCDADDFAEWLAEQQETANDDA